MQLHASVVLDTAGVSEVLRRFELAIGVTALAATVGPFEESTIDAEGLGIESRSATENPVASGWLTGLHRFMSLRWRSVSIFLKMLISAPAVKLHTLKFSSGAKSKMPKTRRRSCLT